MPSIRQQIGRIIRLALGGDGAPSTPAPDTSVTLTATLSSDAALLDYPVEITVHYGAGTSSGLDVYLAGSVRSDFADLRFKNLEGTYLPFWIREQVDEDYAKCVVLVPNTPGFIVLETGVVPVVGASLKLGLLGDPHYAPVDINSSGYVSHRTQVLTWLDRFNARMETFAPDGVMSLGDNTTASQASEKTSLLTDFVAKIAEATAPHTVIVGNHDFEFATPAEVRAVLALSQTYLQPGKLYGSFDLGNFHVVVLDPEYSEASPYSHNSAVGGIGHGYIPNGTAGSDDELGWLTADLAATTKPTIVLCHVTLDEFDGSTFYTVPTTDFDRFSVTNRAAVRAVLEASGKVACVILGHQHYFRTAIVKGIPYIHTPSFCDTGAYPFRMISDSDRGRWLELSIDHAKGEITADLYEDHSTRGAELAARQVVYYAAAPYSPSNPYKVFALGDAAAIGAASTGAPSFDGGDLTQWTVVTDTVNEAPVDLVLAQTKYGDPVAAGGGLTIKGGSTAKAGLATRRFVEQTGKFKLSCWLQLPQADKLCRLYLVNPAGNTIGPRIEFTASGTVTTGAGAALGTYAANTPMHVVMSIDVATDTYSLTINDEVRGTGLAFEAAVTSLDRMRFGWPAGSNGTTHLDEFRIQPVAASEPALISWQEGIPTITVERASTGKLLYDGFSGDLSQWTTVTGSPGAGGGKLIMRMRPTNIPDKIAATFASNTGIYLTVKIRHQFSAGYTDARVFVHDDPNYAVASYELGTFGRSSAPRNNTIGEYVNSVRTSIADSGAKTLDFDEHSWALKITDGVITAYRDGVQSMQVSDASVGTFDNIGVYGGTVVQDGTDYVTFDDIAVMKSHLIMVNGLPTGWKARCAGVTATESGGTATLDVSGKMFPQSLVEILDATDMLQGAYLAANDVWAGDVITVTP